MAKQTINPGTAPTGAGGDTFRSGSAKLQANDDEIYAQLGATAQGVLPAALPINKGGTGATTVAAARKNLGLGTAAVADIGTSNIGEVVPTNPENINDFMTLASRKAGFFQGGGGGAVGFPTSESNMQYSSIIQGFRTNPAGICIFANASVSPRLVAYSFFNGVMRECKIYTSVNTTTDANGFIKAASPIARLFADRVELNDEAEQQDISFEKLGVGDYLIKDSSGFAQEGWYVETPKDANGNVLFSVIYTTLENGDISVKTYKKKFDFETVSIVADLDNPVDITENRWIDLRLQELPQPEIEEPESIAPPEFQPTGLAEAVATVMESHHDSEQ